MPNVIVTYEIPCESADEADDIVQGIQDGSYELDEIGGDPIIKIQDN